MYFFELLTHIHVYVFTGINKKNIQLDLNENFHPIQFISSFDLFLTVLVYLF